MKYGKQTGYDLAYEGQIYNIPEEQIQQVFTAFLSVEPEELRERMTFDEQSKHINTVQEGCLTAYLPPIRRSQR